MIFHGEGIRLQFNYIKHTHTCAHTQIWEGSGGKKLRGTREEVQQVLFLWTRKNLEGYKPNHDCLCGQFLCLFCADLHDLVVLLSYSKYFHRGLTTESSMKCHPTPHTPYKRAPLSTLYPLTLLDFPHHPYQQHTQMCHGLPTPECKLQEETSLCSQFYPQDSYTEITQQVSTFVYE